MEGVHSGLLALQELDEQIDDARQRLQDFEPQLTAVGEPVGRLEREVEEVRVRLEDLRQTVRRLEQAADYKRERLTVYQQRLQRVRNAREEAAARAEMDLVRRAVEADETEALELMEQATRTDLKLDELTVQLEKLRAESTPRREELLAARSQVEDEIAILQDRRANHVLRLDRSAVRLYERLRGGRSAVVLARMTAEGACGHCFNMLPLQVQSEVKQGDRLLRCEACGVILFCE